MTEALQSYRLNLSDCPQKDEVIEKFQKFTKGSHVQRELKEVDGQTHTVLWLLYNATPEMSAALFARLRNQGVNCAVAEKI